MNKIDINALLKDILAQSEALAVELLKDYEKQGVNDVKQFLTDSKSDLERWTGELAQQQLSEAEFKDLVQGQIDVALMHGLKESGLAQVEIDKFTNGVVNIVTSVALNAAGKLF